jgi:TatD DNase family protein
MGGKYAMFFSGMDVPAKKARWADAHCHLASASFSANLDEVLDRSRAAGIGLWVQGGVDPADWTRQIQLAQSVGSDFVPVLGLHPWVAAKMSKSEIDDALEELQKIRSKISALGETGIDKMPKHASDPELENQRHAFVKQLRLALEWNTPLVLHVVRAHDEVLETLAENGPFPHGGIVHAFSGSAETAARYRDMGFLVSLGPHLSRPGYKDLKAAIPSLPSESFVLETDSPDQMEEPSGVLAVAKAVAAMRRTGAESILDQCTANLKRCMGI